MRPPPHPLILAAVLGAVTGAGAAWLLEGAQRFETATPVAPQQVTLSKSDSPRPDPAATEKLEAVSSVGVTGAPPTATAPPTLPPGGDPGTVAAREQDALAAIAEIEVGNQAPRPSAGADAETEVERAFSAILWDKAADLVDADRSCVTGNPIACLELADHEDSIQAFGKSRAHRERAYAILVLKCHNREPDACVTIARMHALGLGIARDAASERALFARAKTLCKSRQGKVCAAMNP
jgi:hypothetical protein